MNPDDIYTGHYYLAPRGRIRYVEEIGENGFIAGRSREIGEATWPGRIVAPLDVFAALSICECDENGAPRIKPYIYDQTKSQKYQAQANDIKRDIHSQIRRALQLLDEVDISQVDYMTRLHASSAFLHGNTMRSLYSDLKQVMQQAGSALESE